MTAFPVLCLRTDCCLVLPLPSLPRHLSSSPLTWLTWICSYSTPSEMARLTSLRVAAVAECKPRHSSMHSRAGQRGRQAGNTTSGEGITGLQRGRHDCRKWDELPRITLRSR
ncbi:hypothetical protein DAEQUDRAFT_216894 [Daedalea quercina L-15889]|uniref:Uncharacterized protein n=1 Tax=Daedalea quercina L-15889 TaxID=1314783 RepID=A0A165R4V5_9APHY|nr:hypothetical protein DAEQUDRAFT_216894 [Daedalea quercina L-15889]